MLHFEFARSRLWWVTFIVFTLANTLDTLSTYIAVQYTGLATEANPCMAWLMHQFPQVWPVFKLIWAPALLLFIAAFYWSDRLGRAAVFLCTSLFVLVSLYTTSVLLWLLHKHGRVFVGL